jgi:hypothetical protein
MRDLRDRQRPRRDACLSTKAVAPDLAAYALACVRTRGRGAVPLDVPSPGISTGGSCGTLADRTGSTAFIQPWVPRQGLRVRGGRLVRDYQVSENHGAPVEDLRVSELQGEVLRDTVENLRAGGEDCGVHGQQVLVDQPGGAGERRERRRPARQEDVLAALLLQRCQLAGNVPSDDDLGRGWAEGWSRRRPSSCSSAARRTHGRLR